jgi:hypothetical protein
VFRSRTHATFTRPECRQRLPQFGSARSRSNGRNHTESQRK